MKKRLKICDSDAGGLSEFSGILFPIQVSTRNDRLNIHCRFQCSQSHIISGCLHGVINSNDQDTFNIYPHGTFNVEDIQS